MQNEAVIKGVDTQHANATHVSCRKVRCGFADLLGIVLVLSPIPYHRLHSIACLGFFHPFLPLITLSIILL